MYQITNRGKVIITKSLEFPKTNEIKFEVNVVFAMVPQCNIVVFYFRPNNDLISEEITVDFADDLPNYVSQDLVIMNLKY